ncbi:porin family protein [Microbulbifer litoralis]|uniref:porin family protein n=1 Tax=Microbulbifer litoralis TaxID=2933965 RepID=UPI0020278B2D|nr:porin family protein [Microbulbifer sp. GX H0434]
MRNVISLTFASGISLIAAGSAQAYAENENGLYLGASYGYMKARDAEEFEDDNDIGRLVIGNQFNRYFAIEGAYIDFGEYGGRFASADTDGYSLGANFTLPLSETFGLYARGGQLWWNSDYDVAGFGGDADGSELFYGAGAKMALSKNVDMRLEYTRYNVNFDTDELGAAAEIDELDTDLDYANVTLQYNF